MLVKINRLFHRCWWQQIAIHRPTFLFVFQCCFFSLGMVGIPWQSKIHVYDIENPILMSMLANVLTDFAQPNQSRAHGLAEEEEEKKSKSTILKHIVIKLRMTLITSDKISFCLCAYLPPVLILIPSLYLFLLRLLFPDRLCLFDWARFWSALCHLHGLHTVFNMAAVYPAQQS